jgi:hypothetical protein
MTTNTTTATVVKITLKQLKNLDACEDQLKLFEEVFGESVSFKTKAQAIKVAVKVAQKFDFEGWASANLLKGGYRKAYWEAEAPLLKAYEEAVAPLWEAYQEAKAPLLKAYNEAVAPLWEAYQEALAKEFAKCYFDQEEQNHS